MSVLIFIRARRQEIENQTTIDWNHNLNFLLILNTCITKMLSEYNYPLTI